MQRQAVDPLAAAVELERRRRGLSNRAQQQQAKPWPDLDQLRNNATGRTYSFHHDEERRFVLDDAPRYMLAKGGEGGGKSVAGIVKTLFKLSRGIGPGIMGSPDLPHFKKSLWPEFRRWCPWDYVIKKHRHRASLSWEPSGTFDLIFDSPRGQVVLTCGGFEDPSGWEGPNLNFAYFDEARRHKTPEWIKTIDGRVRITGPAGEPPQIWIATTPRKHWLWEYFGPLVDENDLRADFKRNAYVVDLLTRDNAANLADGFVEARRQSLTEAEARVLLEAAWEDIDTGQRFLPSIAAWDNCRADPPLPPLVRRDRAQRIRGTPLVVALDAAVSGDTFAMIGVSRHPDNKNDVAVRLMAAYKPPAGGQIDYATVEAQLYDWLDNYNVQQVTFDAYQLHDMMQRLTKTGRVYVSPFGQGPERLIGDKGLLDLIQQRRISHDGDAELRAHIDNADRQTGDGDNKLRIVKREGRLKIDLAVALAMAAKRCLDMNL